MGRAGAPPRWSGLVSDSTVAGQVIRLVVPRLTPLLNVTSRQHWSARSRARREWAWDLRAALGRQPRPAVPFARARVVIERRSIRTPDRDGLYGGAKGVVDCLLPQSKRHPTGLGFVADDTPAVMDLEVRAVRVATLLEQKTIITITELASSPATEVGPGE